MSFVNSIGTQNTQGASSGAPANTTPSGLNQLDNTQTFLKLLVAQLKNQNPDNPTDPTSFMTEIAQLTAVQSQTTLDAQEQTVAADSMLGRTVSGTGSNGTTVTGTVTGVALASSGPPELELSGSGGNLSLDQVTKVYALDPSASASAGTTGSSPSSTTSTSSGSGSSGSGSTTPTA